MLPQILQLIAEVLLLSGCCRCRRIQQLEGRAEALEAKLDASASEAGQLIRRADRHETATATLQVGAHHVWRCSCSAQAYV
jgi:outer membrane murein-binding lipoprotein Lpp